MPHTDYPRLFYASDQASREAQTAYFRVLAIQLSLFFLVGLLGTMLRLFPTSAHRHVAIAIAVLLFLAIVASYVGRERKFDKTWFDARALAESSKTAAWRYMMRAAPFGSVAGVDVDATFLAELEEIRKARPGIDEPLTGQAPNGKSISDYMRQLRSSDFATRKATYLKDRTDDQKSWYGAKATWNKNWKKIWYWLLFGLQTVALILAILAAVYGPFAFNVVGVLMTVAAAGTAWSQAKRHDELSNSYSLAAQELQHIESLIEQTTDEERFLALVDQGEEAISREHTMWCARRSISIPAGRRE